MSRTTTARGGEEMDKREIIAEFASLLFSAMENAKAEFVDLATLNGFRENLDFLLSIGEETMSPVQKL